MKILLSKEGSKIQSDDGEVLLEVEGGSTADAARIFAGAMGPLVKLIMAFDGDDDEDKDAGDESVPDEDSEDSEDDEDAAS